MTTRSFSLLVAAVLGLSALPSRSQAAAGSNAGVVVLENGKVPFDVVSEVVVPVPSEIFSVLDKLGEPNWHQEERPVQNPTTPDRVRLALIFGSVVAEGFVAVQAQDKKAVEDIGREVIDLSQKLGINKTVLPHAQAILDAADRNQWTSIRAEFDRTQKTVREKMDTMKDAPLSQSVSLGGWLRGTAAVTSVVGKNYSADRAELLFQPELVKHFEGQIAKMPAETRKHPTIKAISAGLKEIRQIMEKSADGFKVESVSRIGVICNELLGKINSTK